MLRWGIPQNDGLRCETVSNRGAKRRFLKVAARGTDYLPDP